MQTEGCGYSQVCKQATPSHAKYSWEPRTGERLAGNTTERSSLCKQPSLKHLTSCPQTYLRIVAVLDEHGVCLLLADTYAELLEGVPELGNAGSKKIVMKGNKNGNSGVEHR
eukprot:1160808-Pelagomonas_calceolata.AAC.3